MSDDESGGFDLQSAIQDGVETVRETVGVLGVEREAFVCPECNAACDPTTTYDPDRAAFDAGASPAWECGECGRAYVREEGDGVHTLDLYARDPPQ